jgi:hypothetical protein
VDTVYASAITSIVRSGSDSFTHSNR